MLKKINSDPGRADPGRADSGRLAQLDALRGLLAFSVLLWHYSLLFSAGSAFQGVHNVWTVLTLTPFYVLFAGHQAVLIFFVLSGIALTYMLRAIPSYWVYVYRRICRLYLPYLAAVVLVFGAKALFYDHPIAMFGTWFSKLWFQPLSLQTMLDHVVFVKAFKSTDYNYVLWSLVHEMRLSLLFPLVLIVMARLSWKQSLAMFLGLSLLSGLGNMLFAHRSPALANYLLTFHYLLMFGVGALIAQRYNQIGDWYKGLPQRQRQALIVFGVLSYTYGVLPDRFGIGNAVVNDWMTLPGAVIFILAALYSQKVQKFLLGPVPQFLGRISYSLYLIHPVLQLGVIYALRHVLPLPVAALLAFLLTVPAAALMYKAVELPSISLGRKIRVRRPAFPAALP